MVKKDGVASIKRNVAKFEYVLNICVHPTNVLIVIYVKRPEDQNYDDKDNNDDDDDDLR